MLEKMSTSLRTDGGIINQLAIGLSQTIMNFIDMKDVNILRKSKNILIFALTVPVLHPVRSAHGSFLFKAISNLNSICYG